MILADIDRIWPSRNRFGWTRHPTPAKPIQAPASGLSSWGSLVRCALTVLYYTLALAADDIVVAFISAGFATRSTRQRANEQSVRCA